MHPHIHALVRHWRHRETVRPFDIVLCVLVAAVWGSAFIATEFALGCTVHWIAWFHACVWRAGWPASDAACDTNFVRPCRDGSQSSHTTLRAIVPNAPGVWIVIELQGA
jgi:hypothetical protein